MLTGKNLSYDIGSRHVFSNVNFSVSNGDKVGLIGPNGAGKTTLLHIMTGEIEPTSGDVIRDNVEVGLLPQDLREWLDVSVYDFLEDVTGVKSVKQAYSEAEAQYNSNPDDKTLILYCDAAERLGFFGVDEFDGTVEKALRKAGLTSDLISREIGALSGGQRTRVALAAIMANRYDVVLLDEPTNNLDKEGIVILEKYIQGSKAAFFMVSHDRRFLRNATTRIIELLGGDYGVNQYGLGYDEYVQARQNAYSSEVKRYEEHGVAVKALEASIRERKVKSNSGSRARRTDNDKLGANYRAGRAASSISRQAEALETRLEQLKATEPIRPQEPVTLDFLFVETDVTPQDLINAKDLVVSYDEDSTEKQFGPFQLNARMGDRILISGPNGVGKSTLIRALMGELHKISGEVSKGSSATIAYIDQEQSLPDPSKTPLENLIMLAPGIEQSEAMHLLIKFNLARENVTNMRAENLSGGERMKVLLAAVAAKRANVLVLDEPTNNLDIPTIEGLQQALKDYKGAIILVSHDREFVEGLSITKQIKL